MPESEYRKKRNFSRTPEPKGGKSRSKSGPVFVIQEHDASNLHYDFRLEIDGVLKSWAVPKGPSTDPREKRLAIPTEDHPLEYAGFEGVIPEGEYGGGTVLVWDTGRFENITEKDGAIQPASEALKKGHLLVRLHGEKLTEPERALIEKGGPALPIKPMLAVLTDRHFSDPDWIYERKFDGERAIALRDGDAVRLCSRNGKEISETYPEIAEAMAGQKCDRFMIDGEIVTFRNHVTSFSRLQMRMQIKDPDEARSSQIKVFMYLFDIIYLDGWRLEKLPLRQRKSILRQALSFSSPLRYTAHRNETGEAYLETACERGWEGLIAKRADAPYQHKRSRDWLKFKCGHGQELVIGGFTQPQGERKGFGALLLGYYEEDELRYAGKVGTGFDDAFLTDFRARLDRLARKTSPFADMVKEKNVTWVTPKLVGEFGFTEWTRRGRLRHPRFLGLRRDKAAKDVVREESDGRHQ